MCWHRPIFPGRFQPSIVGTDELNFRVRDGNGWTLAVKDTDYELCSGKRTKKNEQKNDQQKQSKPSVYQYQSAKRITTLTPLTYQTRSLQVTLLT